MSKTYGEDVIEVAIRHAGHGMLCDAAAEVALDDMHMPTAFDRKMRALIGRETVRRGAKKAMKITLRVAAIAVIVIFVFSAVVFSSDALRATVYNMFSHTGESHTTIQFVTVDPDELPEGIILPAYMTNGFSLVEASEDNHLITSRYEDEAGNVITIEQHALNMQMNINSEASTLIEIEGQSVYVIEKSGYTSVIFNTDQYCILIHGTVDQSELVNIAESILILY